MRLITFLFLLTLLLHGCKSENSKKIESSNFQFVELGNGVYICIHKFGGKDICNVGIVDNGRGGSIS